MVDRILPRDATQRSIASAKGHVLIVEDHSVSRLGLATLFRMRGWDVSAATTLNEAMGLLDPAPDCVLLDLSLPDGNGEELLQKLQRESPVSRVIVTTGCRDDSRLAAIERFGAEAVFSKPIDLSRLFSMCAFQEVERSARTIPARSIEATSPPN